MQNPNLLLMIVTNPLDVMTYTAPKLSGILPNRVMGVGTLLDSACFHTLLSQKEPTHSDDLRPDNRTKNQLKSVTQFMHGQEVNDYALSV